MKCGCGKEKMQFAMSDKGQATRSKKQGSRPRVPEQRTEKGLSKRFFSGLFCPDREQVKKHGRLLPSMPRVFLTEFPAI